LEEGGEVEHYPFGVLMYVEWTGNEKVCVVFWIETENTETYTVQIIHMRKSFAPQNKQYTNPPSIQRAGWYDAPEMYGDNDQVDITSHTTPDA